MASFSASRVEWTLEQDHHANSTITCHAALCETTHNPPNDTFLLAATGHQPTSSLIISSLYKMSTEKQKMAHEENSSSK